MPIPVLVADSDRLVRRALRAVLEDTPELRIVAEATSTGDTVRLARMRQPQVAVIEASGPGLDGLDAIRRVRSDGCATRFLVFSPSCEAGAAALALRAGAAGFLHRSATPAEIVEAVRSVAADALFLDASLARAVRRGRRSRHGVAHRVLRLARPPGPGLRDLLDECARRADDGTRLATA